MARRKSITTETIHASHWDNHECVVIRSQNTDDEEWINDQIAGITADGKASIHGGRQKRLTLQRCIVSWTLTDEQNKPLPVNEQSIRELATEDSQYIFEAIGKLNKPMTDNEKKDATPSASSSTGTAESPRKQR
jgi:hypothetical protein